MNTKSIKNRATEVLMTNRSQYMRVLIYVALLSLIPSLFNEFFGSSNIMFIVYIILSILFLPIEHGRTVASIKMVRNMPYEVKDEDALSGFKRFGELFPTYLLVYAVRYLFMLVLGLILGLVISLFFSDDAMNFLYILMYGTSTQYLLSFLTTHTTMIYVIAILLIIDAVLYFALYTFLFPVPHLIEIYNIKGFKSISLSFKMMRGHFLDYSKLFFSYLGWMVLMLALETVLTYLIPLEFIISVVVEIATIYVFSAHMSISLTVLFEEIAYRYVPEA